MLAYIRGAGDLATGIALRLHRAGIQVVMADDQIQPDQKENVVIQLPQDLADGSYTLTAAAGVTSKSGEAMKEDYTLTFTVGQAAQSGESDTQADGSANGAASSTSSLVAVGLPIAMLL